ncbi:E3 SUMO-protein ligase ZBED1-like [Tachysurus ichikawai]
MRSCVLQTRPIYENHTSEHLSEMLTDVVAEWKLERGQSSEAQMASSSSGAEPGPSETSPPQIKSAMAVVFADFFKTEERRTKPLSDIIHEEVTSYKATGCISVDEDPLAWWKSNDHKYPHNAKLAQRNLTVQGSSVPSEFCQF